MESTKKRAGSTQQVPSDIIAEAGALASVLGATDGTNGEKLKSLTAADFHDLRHVEIFRALKSLEEDCELLNIISLAQRLHDNGSTDGAGGFDYIQNLPDATPSPENFSVWLARVRDFAARRALIS